MSLRHTFGLVGRFISLRVRKLMAFFLWMLRFGWVVGQLGNLPVGYVKSPLDASQSLFLLVRGSFKTCVMQVLRPLSAEHVDVCCVYTDSALMPCGQVAKIACPHVHCHEPLSYRQRSLVVLQLEQPLGLVDEGHAPGQWIVRIFERFVIRGV